MQAQPDNTPHDDPPMVCVIVSRYNGSVTSRLLEGAERVFRERFGPDAPLGVVEAPGAFELASLSAAVSHTEFYDGIVALGCVIRGETDHDRYISHAVADALANLPGQTGVPVAFGVITANTPEQAEARAGGDKGNKGAEAMHALLDTIDGIDHVLMTSARGEPAAFRLDGSASPDKAGGR